MMIVSHEKNLDEQYSSKKHIKRDFLEKKSLNCFKIWYELLYFSH